MKQRLPLKEIATNGCFPPRSHELLNPKLRILCGVILFSLSIQAQIYNVVSMNPGRDQA
jgi:hypothetical protein